MSLFLDEATDLIHAAGGRMTPQRQLILRLLEDSDMLLDAEALYEQARQEDASINLATVYRTLSILEKGSLIQQRYLSQDHERRYFEPTTLETQYYFTCRHCKRRIPFKTNTINDLQRHLEQELGIQINSACICFGGVCADCLAEENQSK